jgi:hypothetical protein
VAVLVGHRKRQVVTLAIAAAAVGVFFVQWALAPRVQASPAAERQLPAARGELYLGESFEGLALRSVDPFVYSTCEPGKRKTMPVPCEWLRVDGGRVSGGDPKQVARAREQLRPVD